MVRISDFSMYNNNQRIQPQKNNDLKSAAQVQPGKGTKSSYLEAMLLDYHPKKGTIFLPTKATFNDNLSDPLRSKTPVDSNTVEGADTHKAAG